MPDSSPMRVRVSCLDYYTRKVSLPSNVNIAKIYMPLQGSPYDIPDDFDDLGEMIHIKSKTGPVLICGDANSRTCEIPEFIAPQICEDMHELMQARQ